MIVKKQKNNPIYLNKDIRYGLFCITGTNIPLADIFDYLSKGYSVEDILGMHPTLDKEKINDALKATSKLLIGGGA